MKLDGRNRLLAAIHAAKRARGLNDEDYRDLLATQTGKRSAAELSEAQLGQVLDHLNGGRAMGRPPRATSSIAAKARALWISLHELGMVEDPSERALGAWVKRQYGVDDLRFVRAADSFAVIEGLKQWAVRAGVNWNVHRDPRRCVLSAQWRRLAAGGATPAEDLSHFAEPIIHRPSIMLAEGTELDRVIVALGALVRALPR